MRRIVVLALLLAVAYWLFTSFRGDNGALAGDGARSADLSAMMPAGISPNGLGPFRGPWAVLMSTGPLPLANGMTFHAAYPILPWLGLMAAGYGFGAAYRLSDGRRRLGLFGLGLLLTAAFVALRGMNRYGDPRPWSEQPTGTFTLLVTDSQLPLSLLVEGPMGWTP